MPTQGQKKRAGELIDLARQEFGTLWPGEEEMLRAAGEGRTARLATKEERDAKDLSVILRWDSSIANDAERERRGSPWGCWAKWGEHRKVRAEVFRWLCASSAAAPLIDPFGIRLNNALIVGRVDLDEASIKPRIGLGWCAVPDGLSLLGASLTTLSLSGCCLDCPRDANGEPVGNSYTLNADRLKTTGSVFLRTGFRSRGQVSLLGATIGGNLGCTGADLDCARDAQGTPFDDPYTLNADGIKTTGSVFLSAGFRSRGEVRLLGATLGGDLDCDGADMDCARDAAGKPVGDPYTLNADGLTVDGTLFLRRAAIKGRVDLTRARAEYLNDDGNPWPDQVLLTDFRYRAIHHGSLGDVKWRKTWLANHDKTFRSGYPDHPPDPQPYRHLARVLREQGHDAEARDILALGANRRAWARWIRAWGVGPELRPPRGMEGWETAFDLFIRGPLALLFGLTCKHGYARVVPVVWMVVTIGLGAWVFGTAHHKQRMQPAHPVALKEWDQRELPGHWLNRYPHFHPLVYSADVFLPLVSFHQEDHWTPSGGTWVKKLYLPLHIGAGWFLTTMSVVGFTGMLRQDKD